MEFKDYYEILEVATNATMEEIKTAYRKKARLYHPDRYSATNISQAKKDYYEEKFKEVSEAYEVLRDFRKRRAYNFEYNDYYSNPSNYQEETSEDTEESFKTSNFVDNLKEAYQDIKKEETQNSFSKRHKKISRKLEKEFVDNRETFGQEIIFRFGSGVVHVFSEVTYQLDKLKLVREDGIAKSIIRNRILLITIFCAIIIGNAQKDFNKNIAERVDTIEGENNYQGESSTITIEDDNYSYPSYITLQRNYLVSAGETLSELAYNSGTSANSIKRLNNLTTDLLYYHDEIEVPYIIDSEDLQYYTMTVQTNGKSIYDLATEYETDVETIYKLNEEAINKVSNSYIILSDNILVPNFISKEELKAKKEYQPEQQK